MKKQNEIQTDISVNIGKINESYSLDFAKLPFISQTYIINYGLKQTLNDAAAGISDKGYNDKALFISHVKEAVGKRLSQLIEGNPPKIGSGVQMDSLDKRIYKILAVKSKIAKKELPKTLEELVEIMQISDKKLEEIKDSVKKIIEAEQLLAVDDMDTDIDE